MSEFWSKRDQAHHVANSLDQFAGPHCGDIYATALELFSRLTYPRHASVYYRDDIDRMAAGMNEYGNIIAEIGTHPATVTPEDRLRINERFQLSDDQQLDEVYLPFILAHELAHTIQHDENFTVFFGKLADNYVNPDEDFAAYANSDEELNADYIAAVIVGNSKLGQQIGFMPPTEPPLEWRAWADAHPIPESIAFDLVNRAS